MKRAPKSYKKQIPVGMFILLCVLFFFVGLVGINEHTDVIEMDTVAYLNDAMKIKEIGILGLSPACLKGKYTLANRHPAYLSILSLVVDKRVC